MSSFTDEQNDLALACRNRPSSNEHDPRFALQIGETRTDQIAEPWIPVLTPSALYSLVQSGHRSQSMAGGSGLSCEMRIHTDAPQLAQAASRD